MRKSVKAELEYPIEIMASQASHQEASPIQIMEGMMGGEVLRPPPNREVLDGNGREVQTAKAAMPVCSY